MSSGSGVSGVALIVFLTLTTSVVIMCVTGMVSHWVPIIAGIVVGLIAVKAITR
jgi:hypothetical protein